MPFIIYQDNKQYIILHENNTYEVINKGNKQCFILNEDNTYEVIDKPSPVFKIPDDIFILTPKAMQSAIKGYIYDLERKKKAYQLRKEKLKVQKEEQQEAVCH